MFGPVELPLRLLECLASLELGLVLPLVGAVTGRPIG